MISTIIAVLLICIGDIIGIIIIHILVLQEESEHLAGLDSIPFILGSRAK